MTFAMGRVPHAGPQQVAFPFSRGSSPPRDQTQVSHIAGRFSTIWATREAQEYWIPKPVLNYLGTH